MIDAVSLFTPDDVVDVVLKVDATEKEGHDAAEIKSYGVWAVEVLFHGTAEAEASDEYGDIVEKL